MLIYSFLILLVLSITFFIVNSIILNKVNQSSKIRIWWENNICSSKDLEPYD